MIRSTFGRAVNAQRTAERAAVRDWLAANPARARYWGDWGSSVRNGFFARKFGPGGGGHGAHGGLGGGDGALARNFGPQNYMSGAEEGAGAPQSAQVAYPYYTTRGPRDFLLNNPPPLGY